MSKEVPRTLAEVLAENEELRARLQEAKDTLEAIQNDQVDALVVTTSSGEQVYTLKSAEQPYRVLVENMEEGAVTLLPDCTILYANRRFAEMAQRPLERVIGSNLCDLFSPADQPALQALLDGKGERGEFSLLAADETILPVVISPGSTVTDGVTYPCLVVTDLSEQKRHEAEILRLNEGLEERVKERTAQLKAEVAERKRAEEALQARHEELQITLEENRSIQEELRTQNEELMRTQENLAAEQRRYEDLFHFAPDAYLTTDLQGTIQEINRAALGLFNVRMATAMGAPLGMYVAEEARGAFLTRLMQLREPATRLEFEIVIQPHDRPPFEAAVAVGNVTDAGGDAIGCHWVIRDVSERKREQEALRESEERFRVAQELSPDGFTILRPVRNTRGRVVDFIWLYENVAIARLNGTDPKIVVGRRLLELLPGHAGSRFLEAYQHVAETGEPRVLEELYHGDSIPTPTWFRVAVVPLGEDIAILSQDITERKTMETELRTAKAVAESANAAKDHFLAVLSHELRTPLTPVLMMASALETDPGLPQSVREDMTMIKRSVELEVDLIDDLLDVNRIAHGKLKLTMQDVDAHNKIKAAADVCRSEAQERGLVLHTELAAGQSHVRGDGSRLQQVVWNLLKNAIKFTPRGGRVELRTCNPGPDTLRVEVEDTGMGMAPEVIPRLFGAFEQGSPNTTRQFGGLGLGLAICKSLVEMHGGSIRAESAGLGRGATFSVELPTIPAASDVQADGEAGPGEVRRSARVLLVEDHGMSAEVLTRLLQRAGHKVKAAHSLQAALEYAAAEPYDVLISDLGLPDGNGLDLIRQIRKAHPDLQAIALSGYGTENDVQRSKEAGFSEHLVKPVDFVTLRSAVERAINAR